MGDQLNDSLEKAQELRQYLWIARQREQVWISFLGAE
jgi:hypothetical protein